EAAVPYIASIVHCLGEHTLEARQQHRALAALNARPGRPDRATLLRTQEGGRHVRPADDQARDAEQDRNHLEALSLDPLHCLALVLLLGGGVLARWCFGSDCGLGWLRALERSRAEQEALDRRLRGMAERNRGKSEVVDAVLARRLTLLQASSAFRRIHEETAAA